MNFESVPPPKRSAAEQIKSYLEESKEAHEFDVANLELSEDQLGSIVELIKMSEKAREAIRSNNWGEEGHKSYMELKDKINDLISSMNVTSDQSDAGMLAAFLKNKLLVVDLVDSRLGK